jgi:hypothetical protein
MTHVSNNDDYIPYAKCEDCGSSTIIPFIIKPSSNGFCDQCGCFWAHKPFVNPYESFQASWKTTIETTAAPVLSLVFSNKETIDLKQPTDNFYPEDYCECKECGYDHKYDANAALRKHQLM